MGGGDPNPKQKAVVYMLSPWEQNYRWWSMKDVPVFVTTKCRNNWLRGILLLGPLFATHCYVKNYLEREKQAHRY